MICLYTENAYKYSLCVGTCHDYLNTAIIWTASPYKTEALRLRTIKPCQSRHGGDIGHTCDGRGGVDGCFSGEYCFSCGTQTCGTPTSDNTINLGQAFYKHYVQMYYT